MKPLAVVWSEQAWKDLDDIYDFIAENSQIEAEKQVFRIIDRSDQLSHQPQSGALQADIDPSLQGRYLVQDNYKVIYFVNEAQVVVATVFDTRQDPEKLKLSP